MEELKDISYFPKKVVNKKKAASFSFLDFEETFKNKILNSKTSLVESLEDEEIIFDDFQEIENNSSRNTLPQIGTINIIHSSNHTKKNVLDLKTKDDLEIKEKIKRVKSFNEINYFKKQNYFSISMNFLKAYEDYKILRKLSTIFVMVSHMGSVLNKRNYDYKSIFYFFFKIYQKNFHLSYRE